MRGYTFTSKTHGKRTMVSPVHAGIYLATRPLPGNTARFPRSCGDIPWAAITQGRMIRFPPFMRGYTYSKDYPNLRNSVSPVHAGIYPNTGRRGGMMASFPRSCGDIPRCRAALHYRDRFPPFMRGYTSIVARANYWSTVSPVHAGIYPFLAHRLSY